MEKWCRSVKYVDVKGAGKGIYFANLSGDIQESHGDVLMEFDGGVQPTICSVKCTLNKFSKCCSLQMNEHCERALTLFDQMLEKELASAHTYNTLIGVYCNLRKKCR
ncbi:pentatricopeptide repeat-containing protein [Tanacetum coccineum]